MAAPTIPNGEEHFFPIIYEGNGAGQRVGKFVPFTDQATVANSVIFNRADNPYMYFNKSGITPDSDKKFTFSCWFKIGEQGSRLNTGLFNSNTDGSNGGNVTRYAPLATFTADGNIFGYDYDSGGYNWYFQTNRTFEDTSKWYHFVLAIDTTQSTSTDRMKVYIDGDQITSFSSSTYPALNQDLYTVMAGGYHILGLGYNAKFDGYIAEVNLIENQQLTPASFGITDTSTGRWIPKTVEPFPTTTTDIAVTVVSSGGNKYALDGVTQDTVTLIEGATYKFDQSDSSNSGHPLRFSTTSDGTHGSGSEYTTGVTTVGTPGSSGAYTQITVAVGAPTLYYYCTNHSGMGGTANTQDQYGTNGFRLEFGDSSALGDDTSGNTNDFTATNLASTDQTTDSPTQNHATLAVNGPNVSSSFSEGNLKATFPTSSDMTGGLSTLKMVSGKYYMEATVDSISSAGLILGIMGSDRYTATNEFTGRRFDAYGYYSVDGKLFNNYDSNSTSFTFGNSYTTNDVIGIAVDLDNDKLYFSKNGTFQNSANPSAGTGGQSIISAKSTTAGFYRFCLTDGGTGSTDIVTANFGQKSFNYTPPTGFVALQQDNLPENSKGITGFSIIKNRDATDGFIWQDSMRGVGQYGGTAPSTAFNTASTDMIQKYLKGGFQTEDADAVNTSGESYVAHNWVLNNGTNVTDTSGDLSTELQANPTAGVSVANFTVSGSGNVTWAHGLGGVPEMGMLFVYNGTPYGTTYHHSVSATPWNNYLFATSSQALATASGIWGSSKPSSTLWTGLVGSLFSAGVPYTFYSFRGIEGFSKVGKYNANNSADGPFVYCGFRPSFLLIKSVGAISWYVIDSKRSPINPVTAGLTWDNNQAEFTNQFTIDFLSNGFKIRNSSSGYGGSTNNTSYSPYVYYAVAENPFVGDGTSPVTAR